METKKLYIAPSIQVVTLDTDCSILTGSQLNDLKKVEIHSQLLLSLLSVPQRTLILNQKKSNPLIHYYILGLRSIGCKPFF